jgi:hypothetical protein
MIDGLSILDWIFIASYRESVYDVYFPYSEVERLINKGYSLTINGVEEIFKNSESTRCSIFKKPIQITPTNGFLEYQKIFLMIRMKIDTKFNIKFPQTILDKSLFESAYFNDYASSKLFLEKGAVPTYVYANGETAITIAKKYRNYNILSLFDAHRNHNTILIDWEDK